jgi:hypothetical protein
VVPRLAVRRRGIAAHEETRSNTFFDDIKTALTAPIVAASDRCHFAPLTDGNV